MKVRLTEKMVSLRLSEEEVLVIESREEIHVGISLGPDQEMRFELGTDSGIEDVTVSIEGSTFHVLLPESWVAGWNGDERVGFESIVGSEDGSELRVKVEKDFRWFKKKSESC